MDTDDYQDLIKNGSENVPGSLEETRVAFTTSRSSGYSGLKDDISRSSMLRMEVFSRFYYDTSLVEEVSTVSNTITQGASIVTVQSAAERKCVSDEERFGGSSTCEYLVTIKAKDVAFATFNSEYLPLKMAYTLNP